MACRHDMRASHRVLSKQRGAPDNPEQPVPKKEIRLVPVRHTGEDCAKQTGFNGSIGIRNKTTRFVGTDRTTSHRD